MFMYTVSSLPLISSLKDPVRWTQVWYATVTGVWFGLVKKKGPKFGYFPEPSKSFLVVDAECVSEAEEMFLGFGEKLDL